VELKRNERTLPAYELEA